MRKQLSCSFNPLIRYKSSLSDVLGKYPPVGHGYDTLLVSRSQVRSQSTWILLTRLLPQTPTSTSRPDPLGGYPMPIPDTFQRKLSRSVTPSKQF
ncbi:uncharacterized protein BO96DRAFT_487732 [Aspergillus niger CBS 101883]|uniref:uncharacterized protein n=1 Tax=Aspergillus lacticoffeatus (strain CBS 101883) TaxID=1450533 RepID=UPI000D7F94EF|nr:uncharacterized protein BO96DRAFT_487732 [Aspergillus niger CBS 101883]PYH51443.1 hypothetical protein BO96DRAFT_487732 [Aspergillus niger CBS 101883]